MPKKSIEAVPETLLVFLDGHPVRLPAERRSLSAIRSYLETLALENQRVLSAFCVDGQPATFTQSGSYQAKTSFSRVEGRSIDLTDMPLRMLETALQETAQARAATAAAVTLVLINENPLAREIWWSVARKLKEPLLTLSLLPEAIYHPSPGSASLPQLRKWQLQQLALLMKKVDETCWTPDATALSSALETRILPWLDKLQQLICLWHQTVLVGARSWDRDVDQRTAASE